MPPPAACGRRREASLRGVVNAILHTAQSGCQWHMPPRHFPPFTTVQRHYDPRRAEGRWQTISHALLMAAPEAERREACRSVAIINSRSVETTEADGPHGYDGGKKVNGRKRHSLTDTIGLLVGAIVHPADVPDRDGAPLLLTSPCGAVPWLRHVFADGAYGGDKRQGELASGPSRSSSDRMLRKALSCCRGDGWLNAELRGSTASATPWLYIASVKLMAHRLGAAFVQENRSGRRWSIDPNRPSPRTVPGRTPLIPGASSLDLS